MFTHWITFRVGVEIWECPFAETSLCFFQVLVSSSSHLSRKEATDAITEITGMDPASPALSQVNIQASCSCVKQLHYQASLTELHSIKTESPHMPTTLCVIRPAVVSSNDVCIVAE